MEKELKHEIWHNKGKSDEKKIAAFRYFDQAERFLLTFLQRNEVEIVSTYEYEYENKKENK